MSPTEEGSAVRQVRIRHHSTTGGLWFAGWLFTIGFAHLGFWQAVLALIIWPYDLGVHVAKLVQ